MTSILIIDDSKPMLSMLEEDLKAYSAFDVKTSFSPRLGVEMAIHGDFDVILCDYKMPELNGTEVFEVVRGVIPDQKFIFLTAYPSAVTSYSEEIPLVAKPFKVAALVVEIERVIQMTHIPYQHRAGTEKGINALP